MKQREPRSGAAHAADRQKLLARVHIARKELGLDEDTYRAMLRRLTGKDSARDLTEPELLAVINDCRVRGWKGAAKSRRAPKNLSGSDRSPQLRKIEALLADAGRPWEYAQGIAGHMFGGKRLEFCSPNELRAIITALVKAAKRASARPEVKEDQ